MAIGQLFEKGLRAGTGQANVKRYNRQLRDLIIDGRATPSSRGVPRAPARRCAERLPEVRPAGRGLHQSHSQARNLIRRCNPMTEPTERRRTSHEQSRCSPAGDAGRGPGHHRRRPATSPGHRCTDEHRGRRRRCQPGCLRPHGRSLAREHRHRPGQGLHRPSLRPGHRLAGSDEPARRSRLYGITATNHGRVVILPGGLPLEADGVIRGAVGVSGGEVGQDQQVAEAEQRLSEKRIEGGHAHNDGAGAARPTGAAVSRTAQ